MRYLVQRRRLMTRGAFERFLASIRFGIAVRSPFDVLPCQCGDVNCHGWRLVERKTRGAKS